MFLFKLSIFKNIFFTLHKSALYIGRPSNIIRKVIFHWMTIPTQFPWIKCIPIFFIRLCRLWGKLENHVRNSKYYSDDTPPEPWLLFHLNLFFFVVLLQIFGDMPPSVLVHHVWAEASQQNHRRRLVMRLCRCHPIRCLLEDRLRPTPIHCGGK